MAAPLPTGTAPPTELACGRLLAALCAALPPLERRFLLGRFRRSSDGDLSPTGHRTTRRFRRANAPSTPHTGVTQAASDVGFLAERIKAQDQRLLQVRARARSRAHPLALAHTLALNRTHCPSPALAPSFLPSFPSPVSPQAKAVARRARIDALLSDLAPPRNARERAHTQARLKDTTRTITVRDWRHSFSPARGHARRAQ